MDTRLERTTIRDDIRDVGYCSYLHIYGRSTNIIGQQVNGATHFIASGVRDEVWANTFGSSRHVVLDIHFESK